MAGNECTRGERHERRQVYIRSLFIVMINTVKGLLSYCLSTLSRDGKEEEKQNKTKNIMYTAKYIKNTIYIGMPPIQERLVKEVE